jgi:hypothetical protein
MDTRQNLETGLARSTGLEFITFADLRTKPQENFSRQWEYNTPYVMDQPVRNREHVRLLLASIDENLDWVTFHTSEIGAAADEPRLFAQAGWRGDDTCVVEVNVEGGGWARRVLRGGLNEVGDISSDNFGNMEMIYAGEQHSLSEAFTICSLWMTRQAIPEGYVFGPVEE